MSDYFRSSGWRSDRQQFFGLLKELIQAIKENTEAVKDDTTGTIYCFSPGCQDCLKEME